MADKNTTSNINLAAAEELPKAQSKFKEFVKKFMKRKTAVISLAFIVFIILMAIIGPYVVPYDPQAPDYTAMMQGPSAAHIWGTNEYGQDVFSRLMVGTRLSLTCALTATIIGTAIGVVLGLIAGFYGGIIDSLIMRCCDVLFAFPDILLAIAVVAIIGMHDAMGVRRETGEQAKVLNKMLEQWIEVTEKNNPFLQNMHLKEMVGHTPLQVMAGFALGVLVGFLYPMGL